MPIPGHSAKWLSLVVLRRIFAIIRSRAQNSGDLHGNGVDDAVATAERLLSCST
jgi:hypothetical protein